MYKKIFEGKKAVIFDLDGTIVDSEPFWIMAYDKVLRTLGSSITKFKYTRGNSIIEIWQSFIQSGNLKTNVTIDQLVEKTYQEFLTMYEKSEIDARKGFIELIVTLKLEKGFKTALVTNTVRKVADRMLKKLDIAGLFDVIICGDEVKKLKPDPEIYLSASQKLSIKPADIIVFEDGVGGVQAARKAKMETIVVWDPDIPNYDYPEDTKLFIPNFLDLSQNMDVTYEELIEEGFKRAAAQIKK